MQVARVAKPKITADAFAGQVVWHLTSVYGKSRTHAIDMVNGAERYVRQAHKDGVVPSFVAKRLASGYVGGRHLKADARDLKTMKSTVARMIRRDEKETKKRKRSGLTMGQTGGVMSCQKWIPPVFVSPEVADALDVPPPPLNGQTTGRTGHIFGKRKEARETRIPEGVTRSKAGNSWAKGGALYVSSSKNSKIGDLDATWVAIANTCVDCKLKDEGVCYAAAGVHSGIVVRRLEKAAGNESATTVAKDEADCIDAAYDGYAVPGHRTLRIHASGDTSTPEGAQVLGAAVDRWVKRGGKLAYTYTHAWRRVPRSSWGKELSVLASVDYLKDAGRALAHGYNSTTIVVSEDVWSSRWVLTRDGRFVFKYLDIPETDTRLKFVPCPAQYPHDKTDKAGALMPGEGLKWKKILIGRKLGIGDDKAAKMKVEDFAKLGPQMEAAGFPSYERSPEAFKTLFRLVAGQETATCETCQLCFDDRALGRKGLGVAFRPDKSGGIEKTEDALRKRTQETIHLAVVK